MEERDPERRAGVACAAGLGPGLLMLSRDCLCCNRGSEWVFGWGLVVLALGLLVLLLPGLLMLPGWGRVGFSVPGLAGTEAHEDKFIPINSEFPRFLQNL